MKTTTILLDNTRHSLLTYHMTQLVFNMVVCVTL